MALDLRQNLKLSQQLLMTPQLQQAIKLLQLSRAELEQYVVSELAENPVLEEAQQSLNTNDADEAREQTSEQALTEHLNSAPETVDSLNDGGKQEVDWEVLSRLAESGGQTTKPRKSKDGDEAPNYENILTKSETLRDYLAEQARDVGFSDHEKEIAAKLIGNVSARGYLETDIEQFCREEGYDFDLVDGVLDTLQRFDPPGVCARTLAECLLNQLREKKVNDPILISIVSEHLEELAKKNYVKIARTLKVSLNEVIEAAAYLVKLDPTPGSKFLDEAVLYIVPDVYVFKDSGQWVVALNEDGLPNLAINDHYRDMLGDMRKGDEKNYISDRLRAANWLIKSVYQRQRTIFRVTECIVKKQQEFFEKGTRFLKPLVLKAVAEEVELHESTISRVTTNKYVHTPRGIFELKYFFSGSVGTTAGEELASESVKTLIRDLIREEDPRKPLSDQKIVEMLADRGINLARRTVAKYREKSKILSSSKRKKYF